MTRWACMRAQGRTLVYWTVYSLDATRCIILHLAATQSLQHARGYSTTCLTCAATVALIALAVAQVGPKPPSILSFLLHPTLCATCFELHCLPWCHAQCLRRTATRLPQEVLCTPAGSALCLLRNTR